MACSWIKSISNSSFVFEDMLPGGICVFGSERLYVPMFSPLARISKNQL
jgi:hypothetical protein